MEPKVLKINYFAYVTAWVKYAGGFLTRLANTADVVRAHFSDISVPKKEDYYIQQ